MLLDAITNQLVGEKIEALTTESSYLWKHIYDESELTFASYTTSLTQQMVEIISSSPSELIADYAISLMVRISERMKSFNYRQASNKVPKVKLADYLSPIIQFTLNVNMDSFGGICHHKQRKRLYEITGLIGVSSMKDLHSIYDAVASNLHSNDQKVLYLIDMTGLMRAQFPDPIKKELIELFLRDITENEKVLSLFN